MAVMTKEEQKQRKLEGQIQGMIDRLEFMLIDINCFELDKPKAAKCIEGAVGKVQEGITSLQEALIEI